MSDDNVVPLGKPVQVKKAFEPQEDLIKMTEQLAADAKSGKLRALLYAQVYHDDLTEAGAAHYDWFGAKGLTWSMDRAMGLLDWRWKEFVNRKD